MGEIKKVKEFPELIEAGMQGLIYHGYVESAEADKFAKALMIMHKLQTGKDCDIILHEDYPFKYVVNIWRRVRVE